MNPKYQRRFVYYAMSLGRNPDDVAKNDKIFHFMLWIRDKINEWKKEKGRDRYSGMSTEDHQEFDAWIEGQLEAAA